MFLSQNFLLEISPLRSLVVLLRPSRGVCQDRRKYAIHLKVGVLGLRALAQPHPRDAAPPAKQVGRSETPAFSCVIEKGGQLEELVLSQMGVWTFTQD